MLRQEYLRRLVDASPIEIYLSGMDGARLYWPWRMLPPKDATRSYRDACERFVIDSDPQRDEYTTEDVLDCAARVDAEVASLADVYQDKDATVDSLLEGLETYDSHEYDGQLLLPLQDPFVECWREIGEPTGYWLGIGGLKDASVSKRITAAQQLRQAAGRGALIHGFGWGVEGKLSRVVRRQPELLDSVDYSTPMQNVNYNSYENGEESKSVAAMQAGTALVRDLRSVSGFVDGGEVTLGAFE